MNKMTVPAGRTIEADVKQLLEDYCNKKGLRLDMKGGFSYTDEMIKLKGVSFYVKGDGSKVVLTEDESMYDLHARMHKLPARGTVFTSDTGEQYKIKCWKSRAHKWPIVAERVKDGARYKFTVDQIQRYAGIK